jgi:hypothetical protein
MDGASVEIARLLFVSGKIPPDERERVVRISSTIANAIRGRW